MKQLDESDIIRLYYVHQYSFIQLSKRFNCPKQKIKQILKL